MPLRIATLNKSAADPFDHLLTRRVAFAWHSDAPVTAQPVERPSKSKSALILLNFE
jgi:hypothetical protein